MVALLEGLTPFAFHRSEKRQINEAILARSFKLIKWFPSMCSNPKFKRMY